MLHDIELDLGATYRRVSGVNCFQNLEAFGKVPEELKQLSKDYLEVIKEFELRLLQLYIQLLEIKGKYISFCKMS